MQRKDRAVISISVVVATGLLVLLAMGRITWEQCLIGLGLLGLPSVASIRGPQ